MYASRLPDPQRWSQHLHFELQGAGYMESCYKLDKASTRTSQGSIQMLVLFAFKVGLQEGQVQYRAEFRNYPTAS